METNAPSHATLRWVEPADDLKLLADVVRMYPGEVLVRCDEVEIAVAWETASGFVGRATDSDASTGPYETIEEVLEALGAQPTV
jgi:hypothetical protein